MDTEDNLTLEQRVRQLGILNGEVAWWVKQVVAQPEMIDSSYVEYASARIDGSRTRKLEVVTMLKTKGLL